MADGRELVQGSPRQRPTRPWRDVSQMGEASVSHQHRTSDCVLGIGDDRGRRIVGQLLAKRSRVRAERSVISHAACVVPTSTPMPSQLTVCRFARVFQRQVRLQRDIATSELCHRGRSAERGRSTRLCRDSAEVGSSTCGRDTFGARARSPRRPTRDGGYGMDGSAESGRTTCSG